MYASVSIRYYASWRLTYCGILPEHIECTVLVLISQQQLSKAISATRPVSSVRTVTGYEMDNQDILGTKMLLQPPCLWLSQVPLQRITLQPPRLWLTQTIFQRIILQPPRVWLSQTPLKIITYSHHVCGSPRLLSKELSDSHHVCGSPRLLCKELPCSHLVRSSPDSQRVRKMR